MIYEKFESILVEEDNEKKNLHEPYINKYEKQVTCNYSYNQCLLMKNSVNRLIRTQLQILSTIQLMKQIQKVNTTVM